MRASSIVQNTSLSSLTASRGKLTKRDAITVICSALDAVDYHGIITEVSSTVTFLSLIPLPFTYLTEPRTSSTVSTSNSDILVVDFDMQIPIHFPPLTFLFFYLSQEKLLHSPNGQLSSLACSFDYVIPEVIENPTPSTSGSWVWLLSHAYTNETQAHCSLSA